MGILDIEMLEADVYSGRNRDIGTPQIFGGQVVAQALQAAYHTIGGDRWVHSLHAYFLRPGELQKPVRYEVHRAMDGRSFSNRRVLAIQNNKPILHCGVSFQVPEAGLFHSSAMPMVPPPEALVDVASLVSDVLLDPELAARLARMAPAVEFRLPDHMAIAHRKPITAQSSIWFKLRAPVESSRIRQEVLLAYLSDFHLLAASLRPHGLTHADLKMASLDHALWWHDVPNLNDWLLFSLESPHANGGRGYSRGQIYNRAGVLVASVAQEGLIRQR